MPPQAAPQSGQAPAVNAPPLLPIPPYRERLFTIGVGERLREGAAKGVSEAQTLAAIAQERTAIAAAIESEMFRDAFARAYTQAHNARTPQAPVSEQQARHATDDIIKNRANDARQLAYLITQPEFVQRARNAPPKPANYALPPEKITEMVARFTAEGSSYGIDARIHNQQSMEGHRIGHLALVDVYAQNGPLHAALTQTLKAQLPALDDVARAALANDWLEARRLPAQATAEQLTENGSVYQQVVQRSDATRVAATQAQADAEHRRAPLLQRGMATGLLSSTALTPQQVEHDKTRQQKAEDFIYTLNHAITCLSITDLLVMPTVNGLLGTMLGSNAPKFGCGGGHEHSHGAADHHAHHHDHAHSPWDELKAPFRNVRNWFRSDEPWSEKLKVIGKNSKNWLISEAAGDIGAVIPTLLMQRYTPGIMDSMRHGLESVFGGSFRRGTRKAAEQWADKNGLEHDSVECVNRAQELYHYEVRHLPQMAVWTVASIGISYGVMRYLNHDMKLPEFARTKIVGAAVTAGLVVGARAFSPNKAHGWDQTVSKHLIVPTTKIIGRPFGVKDEDVDRAVERQSDDAPVLAGRVQDAKLQQIAS